MKKQKCNNCSKNLFENQFRLRTYKSSKDKKAYTWHVGICIECEKEGMRINAQKRKVERRAYRVGHLERTRSDIKYHVRRRLIQWRKKTPENFDLDVDYLVNLYNEQKGLCYYTGKKMLVGGRKGDGKQKLYLSLDRVDPEKGYIKGNVVWCIYHINTMKSDLTKLEFIQLVLDILHVHSQNQVQQDIALVDKKSYQSLD